ncbi:hypothetical protein GCM10010964_10530 [Caldovatus sediminis]|uniref:Uncharacterized protein n=1 Tax=Caldovatus sediminis TaxID=2041189 RepID=A0A8J2Z9N8_9PROT|nr:hypothetical protein [Caldovatus sediminis]GGG24314.1 hypothetical protein GCM10010964_10530 [Caldovatus sediminis]
MTLATPRTGSAAPDLPGRMPESRDEGRRPRPAARSPIAPAAALALAALAGGALMAAAYAQPATEPDARQATAQQQALQAQEQILAFRRCMEHARIRREAERRGLSPAEICTALASLGLQQR